MKSFAKIKKSGILLLPFFFLLAACDREVDQVKEAELLLELDHTFSKVSVEKGMKAAFMDYIDQDAVILRQGSLPIEGKAAVEAYLSEIPEHYFTISWEPINAVVSEDADLGYTYGIWTMVTNDSIQVTSKGTYTTIWRKNEEGVWKLVLDTGTEGL